ncbi:hypothetical protein IAD21_03445 [Abditibacteriota bacterium]|nr:hypothetical protein IAD21_03445 [Abditibacteriota bacterium]
MKIPVPLLRALLGCTVASALFCVAPALAAPTQKAPPSTSSFPAEVRAMMSSGARTLRLARFPVGTGGTPVLLHAWTIGRRSPEIEPGLSAPALFCVDLFYRDKLTHGKWQLASSTPYVGEGLTMPLNPATTLTYTTRWLHPSTKRGVVIVEITDGPTSSTIRLITLPEGVPNQPLSVPAYLFSNAVQEFYSSHNGGENSEISFGIDAKGDMVVREHILPHSVAPQIYNTYGWREGRWIVVATKKVKQS